MGTMCLDMSVRMKFTIYQPIAVKLDRSAYRSSFFLNIYNSYKLNVCMQITLSIAQFTNR